MGRRIVRDKRLIVDASRPLKSRQFQAPTAAGMTAKLLVAIPDAPRWDGRLAGWRARRPARAAARATGTAAAVA